MLVPHEAYKVTQDLGIFSLCQSQLHETKSPHYQGTGAGRSQERSLWCFQGACVQGMAGLWMNSEG